MKFIFIEMDFYLAHHSVDDHLINIFLRLHQQGHKIYLCTRRNKGSLKNLPLPVDGVIASAGSYIEDHNQVLLKMYLSKEDVYRLESALNSLGVMYQLETTDMLFMDIRLLKQRCNKVLEGSDVSIETGRRLKAFKEQEGITEISKYDGEPVHKIGFKSDAISKIVSIEKVYGDEFDFVFLREDGEKITGEIRRKHVDVKEGIKTILQCNHGSVEQSVAFCELSDALKLKDFLPKTIVIGDDLELVLKQENLI